MKDIFRKLLNDRRLWVITIVLFVLLIAFFDKNNLIEAHKLRRQINELEGQKTYYQEKITADSLLLENLNDDSFLEEYAREQYLMRRKGETIYVFK